MFKKSILLLALMVTSYSLVPSFAIEAKAQEKQCYATFSDYYGAVTVTACTYLTGTSGTLKIKNNRNWDIEVCITIYPETGKSQKICKSRLRDNEEASSSCVICNMGKTGGIARVDFDKIKKRD